MSDRLEAAASGRAQCRACGVKIPKGALRFGEELPNAYGEGDVASVYWFHPSCAALRRPEKIAPLLRESESEAAAALADREQLLAQAEVGAAHPKLERLAGAERAASGRARCRHCQQAIAGGAWRLRLSTFADSGFFEPLGFVHAGCARDYFEVPEVGLLIERIGQISPDLDRAALDEIRAAEQAGQPQPGSA
jgi:ribosomal protein L37AE/L43A